jgi:hypothetical protein
MKNGVSAGGGSWNGARLAWTKIFFYLPDAFCPAVKDEQKQAF